MEGFCGASHRRSANAYPKRAVASRSHDNPADCASRGLLGHNILNQSLWWRGPSWLSQSVNAWPPLFTYAADAAALKEKLVVLHISEPLQSWDLFSRFSSWPKLLRVVAYIQRFASACRRGKLSTPNAESPGQALTAVECSNARTFILKHVQMELFWNTIRTLRKNQELPSNDPLLSLRPFLDRDGIVRVGGRISRAPLPFETRHLILLALHRLTKLIINHAHLRTLHAGIQLTMGILRRDFWIIQARSLVREQIHQCIACVNERAAMSTQLMGDLPKERVSAPTRSFIHCGLDYARPVFIRVSAGRGIVSHKAYIALFICLATRAIHLELVVDYSAQAFLNAFSCFSARHGLPAIMYSDNGTNFVGAERELASAYRAALRDANFQNRTATDGITWRFIPPSAPHFGGLWEAGIKSVKHHVGRSLKNQTLTFEEFTTLLCQIEACLNSRPIAPLSDTLDDYEPLTPGHFLIGSALTAIPEPSLLDLNEQRLTRWQLIRQLAERFWRLWYADYVNSLQQRNKWR
ncbi:uncharacterized protein LOC109504397 [Harpegnathos saltator]|uniref:uncharacterized protein LOC109504397 n=1 Tax=Harpegnathos saltator TaxID=610380 RepID=UPI000DBEF09A|nr:uncharacterized protein LOC109504397 [Harpegnathos saltator]XP_025161756.1 uncharacterized protein LOC109504397 [Harpegnathos saltator]XP_025161757.1 uncharacterized protein LOC109504397 [Harpegnathos saltator]